MADAIKDFFKKKKMDAKFKMAGTGHKLTGSPLAATSSKSNQLNTNKTNINRSEGSTQRAGEAAIDRIQRQQQSTHNKTNTLENILQEERKRIKEEYKMKEKVEVILVLSYNLVKNLFRFFD
jgi:UBX domain-containing protein 6